jgi:hypothetical protein
MYIYVIYFKKIYFESTDFYYSQHSIHRPEEKKKRSQSPNGQSLGQKSHEVVSHFCLFHKKLPPYTRGQSNDF